MRFNQLITLPYAPLIEDGHAADAWSAGRPTFHSKILSPHFEELTRIWTRRYARDEADDLQIGPVGSAEISDAKTRTKHEVDVLALAPGQRPQSPRARIILLGEAKATLSPRGPADLERLDRIRARGPCGRSPGASAMTSTSCLVRVLASEISAEPTGPISRPSASSRA